MDDQLEQRRQALVAEMTRRQAAGTWQPGQKTKVASPEEAAQRAADADQGGLEAGPWYMETAKDVLNPVDMAGSMGAGGLKAAGQVARGAAGAVGDASRSALGNTLGRAAEKQNMINLVQGGSELAPYAKGLVDQAITGINEKSIAPKDAALRQLLQGTKGEVNSDLVSPVFPNYAKRLAQRAKPEASSYIGPMGEERIFTSVPGKTDLTGEQLLRLKRGADKAAGYSKAQAPFSEAAASKNADARALADVARNQIYDAAPGSEDLLGEMQRDIRLRQFLQKKSATDPIGLIKGKLGTTKDSQLARVDEIAGTNLRGTGDKINEAVNLQLDPKRLLTIGAPSEAGRMVTRGAIKAGDVANTGAEAAGNALGAVGNAVAKTPAPEVAGWGGSLAAGQEATAHEPTIDRNSYIERVKAEIQRRQGQGQ